MSALSKGLCEFGKFRLDLDRKLLWLDGEPVDLPLKAVELLCVLAERPGEVISKDEIWQAVWKDTFVEETNLTHNIYLLRRTFKGLGMPLLIKTFPRRGYQFTATVCQTSASEIVPADRLLTSPAIDADNAALPQSAREKTEKPDIDRKVSGHKTAWILAAGIALLTLVSVAVVWRARSKGSSDIPQISSLAVLPLKADGASPITDEVRLGVTDALITRLGSLDNVAVRPTTAVLAFDGDERDPRELGRILKVDAVLEGQIEKEGDRLQVALQLISVKNGGRIWQHRFEGTADQLLTLQDSISGEISQRLSRDLTPKALKKEPTTNTDAYNAYLKGRYFLRKRDAESLNKALDLFRGAVATDPQFAEAYVEIADTQLLQYDYTFETDKNLVSEAKETLHRALLLNPNSPEALTTLGSIQMTYDWNWTDAEDSLRRATAASPNSGNAWARLGVLLLKTRRFDEAERALEQALDLDPLSLNANLELGAAYYCAGRYKAAEDQLHRTLSIDSDFGTAHWFLSRLYWQEGRTDDAIKEIVAGLEADGDKDLATRINIAYAHDGAKAAVTRLLKAWQAEDQPNPHNLACLCTYLGDKDCAIEWLQLSFKKHHPWTTWIATAPEFAMLRGDPRFDDLLKKMGLN